MFGPQQKKAWWFCVRRPYYIRQEKSRKNKVVPMQSKYQLAHRCRVLPSDECDCVIQQPLSVYSGGLTVTVFP